MWVPMSDANNHLETGNDRLDSIDQFRGFAILLMVLADYLSRIQRVPAWLKHAPGVGLTVVDLIAPMFILAIGLVYRPSFQRRLLRDGRRQTALHFIRRFLALMGIGTLTPWGYSWGLFQTIGGAGLISLLVIWLPSLVRLIIGALVLGGYQVLSDNIWMRRVTASSSWCEMEGTLSWAAMLILASVLADWYYDRPRGRRLFTLGSLVSLGLGIVLSNWVDVSQYYVSASYVLISLGASGLFLGIRSADRKAESSPPAADCVGQESAGDVSAALLDMGLCIPRAADKRMAYRGPGVADHSPSEWICWAPELGGVVPGSPRVDRLIVGDLPFLRTPGVEISFLSKILSLKVERRSGIQGNDPFCYPIIWRIDDGLSLYG